MFGALLVEMAKQHYDCYQIKYASAEEITMFLHFLNFESQCGPGRQVEVQVAVQKKGFSTYAFELEIHLHLDPMDVSLHFFTFLLFCTVQDFKHKIGDKFYVRAGGVTKS